MSVDETTRCIPTQILNPGDLCVRAVENPTLEQQTIFQELAAHFRPLFEASPDGVYLYLNDQYKVCNRRLADLLACTVEDWSAARPYQERFVAPEDRGRYCWYYEHHVLALSFPVTFRFRALRKDGSSFAAETDMIPLLFHGYPVGYNFVRKVGE